ncbi:hypothetical protein BT096_11865, partial [Corynebacterium diphtheriae]
VPPPPPPPPPTKKASFDLVVWTIARLRGVGSIVVATIDASCDRISDGAVFGAISWLSLIHD